VLRVLNQNDAAEIPLDLASTGAPSLVDTRDTSDALSHAIAARLLRDAAPLVTGKEIDLTIVSATARRFANSLRIVARRAADESRTLSDTFFYRSPSPRRGRSADGANQGTQ
jgi:hypothetical protein